MVAVKKVLQDAVASMRAPGSFVRTPDGGGFTRSTQKRLVVPTVRNGGAPAPAANPANPAPTPAPANPAPTPAPQPEVRANPTPALVPSPIAQQAALSDADIQRVVRAVMAERGAPAVHVPGHGGSDPDRMTRRDLELLSLDNGLRQEDIDRRRASLAGDLPTIDPNNAVYRAIGVGKRQFSQMRGSRNVGTGDLNKLGRASGPSEEVGALFCAWTAYMSRSKVSTGRADPIYAFRLAKAAGEHPVLQRALAESTVVDGGALLPDIVLEDYVEFLYANTIYLQSNPLRVTLTNGKVTIPRVAATSTFNWIGENAAIAPSQEKFDDLVLSLRKGGILVPYSNDLANHAIVALQALIRDDMGMQAAIGVDTAMLRGAGTAFTPKGIRNEAQAGNVFAANAVVNVANVTADLAKMKAKQLAFNVKGLKWFWGMSPRTLMYLWSARNAVNGYIWRDELMAGRFDGNPYGVTTSIPENLGAGSDSELYLWDAQHEAYGEGAGTDGYKFDVRDGEAYDNGSGTVISGYSNDQSVARLIMKTDRVSRQNGKNQSVLTGVQYGV